MTNASGGVAVVATQLAQTDRRALSEAWYSALHLSRGVAPVGPRAARSVAPVRVAAAEAQQHFSQHETPRPAPAVPSRAPRAACARSAEPGERRRPATDTARRIERAVAVLAARARVPAAHTVDVAGGRVRLLVHDDGYTTRIVALCSDPLREQVERALARARFTLAGAGLGVAAP